ncbi:ferredoxin family protein [Amycolatopsis ultiminotia]|uniref:Ferredoxin n=1 Tax=Amycolatopsis ultiminotia TaxID=543629 RepID=A0ABP6YL23_9PSEU
MPYVIGSSCIDTKDRACVEECPVDCIYEGDRKLYINPVECIDCGACEPACPMEAIYPLGQAGGDEFGPDNSAFFSEVLPGRPAPLGNPGGAGPLGPVGVDTLLVRGDR